MTKPCIKCGNDIPAGRLKALPNTTTCVQCSTSDKFKGVITSTVERSGSEDVEVGLSILKDAPDLSFGHSIHIEEDDQ